ncbi:hypothetical protein ACFL27_06085 [candidate division CSSED10-310 bacterium]|uniref:Uncharacterized protein n=1 Tax=candidate division CSSED10-310 bacterium TaxID=2855610 RepID=A0ABV6YU83_UNCC1
MSNETVQERENMASDQENTLFTYSLTGYDNEGILEEVFLLHERDFHPNEFQSMVIHVVSKMRKNKDSEAATIHDVAQQLERKFEFRRFSFYNCYVWDQEQNIICETSVRG